jgi:hypothetical protein
MAFCKRQNDRESKKISGFQEGRAREGWIGRTQNIFKTMKIGTLCGGSTSVGVGEGRRIWWQYMVDELHMPIWNRTKKPVAIALSGWGRGWGGETMRAM